MSLNSKRVSRHRRRLKTRIIEFMGGKCLRCGWNEHPSGLSPHHVNPDKKEFALSAKGLTKSLEVIKQECEKCILLCLNCHSVVHTKRELFWFDEANIPEYKGTALASRAKKSYSCVNCKNPISCTASCCKTCSFFVRRKISWPDMESLTKLVDLHGYRGTGKILGLSDNAVRKRLKRNIQG